MTDDIEIVRTILKKARTASVTTVASSGELHSRPLGVLDGEFEGTLWFFTEDPSAKTAEIAAHPSVNVSVGDGKGWLSFAGSARVTRDAERIDQFWNPWADAYFDGGRDDPSVARLEIEGSSFRYWDLDKPAVVTAYEMVKGILTKSRPDLGEDGVVHLDD